MNSIVNEIWVVVTSDKDGHYDIDGVSLDYKEGVIVASDASHNMPRLFRLFMIPANQRLEQIDHVERASA